jgi:D-alanine--poly(phosphoribitol) ligase subunit 1
MPGVELAILDHETLEPVAEGEPGECFICGHTVAKGYFGRDDLTRAAFASCPASVARGRKSYRTGDEMTIGPDGLLYFHGRLDLQVKLHGFRIELGDIEAALCALDAVQVAAVVPIVRDGQIHHLCACVVGTDREARGIRATKVLKQGLAQTLPAYMVPTQFKYLDELPLNNNGKVDRKALAAAVGA